MGICVSCDTAAGAEAVTAKVVLPTGELREYSHPATASAAIEGSGAGEWFLCDADAMGFEGYVAAVGAAEELRPGQIYFVLPAEMRRRRLTREDVAALAVKASSALVNSAARSAGGRCRRGAVAPLVFAPPEEAVGEVSVGKAAVVGKRRVACRGGGRGQRRKFSPDLMAIPECELSE